MSFIIKILGVLDIIAALFFWIFGIFRLQDNVFMSGFIMVIGFYLLVKGVAFIISADIASIFDIISGIIIIASTTLLMPKIIVIVVSLYLLQKGAFSMLS
jgi:hypothetical protein